MTLFHSPWFSLEPYPEIALTDLLAPAAARHKERPAFITHEGEEHSFGKTWEGCRRLGRFLQDNGLQKGDRVAILSANCPEYFLAFYGTLFGGGAVTTLNPLYKEREVLHQLEDCGQHEFLNWVCLAGAMSEMGQEPAFTDMIESYIFNSTKCFAIFPPASGAKLSSVAG